MGFLGPTMSLVGFVISAWGTFQLAFMSLFFYVRALALLDDVPMKEHYRTSSSWVTYGVKRSSVTIGIYEPVLLCEGARTPRRRSNEGALPHEARVLLGSRTRLHSECYKLRDSSMLVPRLDNFLRLAISHGSTWRNAAALKAPSEDMKRVEDDED
ncbi:unnamed protein product [Notodromas monacha]|uniref:Uncharacterized protein n=1 Tax=Notodromas monacha TaxID=399045 RepID=A0A7R9BXS3_9CRUS|nr:unnamed protein product [Notodromas monacha]CAG0923760.1 unnamed protein product [Notodromas monacha]